MGLQAKSKPYVSGAKSSHKTHNYRLLKLIMKINKHEQRLSLVQY